VRLSDVVIDMMALGLRGPGSRPFHRVATLGKIFVILFYLYGGLHCLPSLLSSKKLGTTKGSFLIGSI